MAHQVRKYLIPMPPLAPSVVEVETVGVVEMLHVGPDNRGRPAVWFLVDPASEAVVVGRLLCVPNESEFEVDEEFEHVASFRVDGAMFKTVWHLFELPVLGE